MLFQHLQQQPLIFPGILGQLGGLLTQAGQHIAVFGHHGVGAADGLVPVKGIHVSGGG